MATTAERGGPFDPGSVAALARAERDGAAPGTELPVGSGIESSPLGGRAVRAWRRISVAVALAAVAIAAWHAGEAAFLVAKAHLGQALLQRAWNDVQAAGDGVKPWPWADTYPVARLTVPALSVDLLVLSGANGRTLAWGPGHAESTTRPGRPGNAVVTGHRDTHFGFLRKLEPGAEIVIEDATGTTRRYRVERAIVADHRALRLPADDGATTLSLVTCYPFDAVDPRTPLRYAVIARAE